MSDTPNAARPAPTARGVDRRVADRRPAAQQLHLARELLIEHARAMGHALKGPSPSPTWTEAEGHLVNLVHLLESRERAVEAAR